MTNSADPDHLASKWSGSTLFAKAGPFRNWKACLTHINLASHKGDIGKSVDPDQTPQNAASDQDLHPLH